MDGVGTAAGGWLAVALAAITAAVAWFWRFVMGHNKRIALLESERELTNAHLNAIEKNTDRMARAFEKMEDRHRQDISKAYEKVEAIHLVVIDLLNK